MTCDDVRRAIHEAHDDEGATLPESVRAHIATCSSCRELEGDLTTLTQALRALPRDPLPPDALDAVWRRTIQARPNRFPIAVGFRHLAAAALFIASLSTATLYFVFAPEPAPQKPTAVELARASAQAELVFGYTARALAATRDATADRILASKVSPAVRGVAAPHPSRRPQ
jgi:predicted anti-sigma-YlaC factor YlaD